MWKIVECYGKPGNICAIFRKSPRYQGMPTKGLAWGPFDENGLFRCMLNTDDQKEVLIAEYEPQFAEHLEKWWHLNTEN